MPDVFVAPNKLNNKKRFVLPDFATFVQNPQSFSFNGQYDKEPVLLLLRRHWITNIGWLLLSLILLFIPVLFIIFELDRLIPFILPFNYLLVIIAFWYIGTLGYILLNFAFWFYNVNVVTNQRILDFDFVYLLYSEISSTIISKVEDVTYKRGGFVASFFDYGDVFVQTAGTDPNLEFLAVPKPSLVDKIITNLMQVEDEEMEVR